MTGQILYLNEGARADWALPKTTRPFGTRKERPQAVTPTADERAELKELDLGQIERRIAVARRLLERPQSDQRVEAAALDLLSLLKQELKSRK